MTKFIVLVIAILALFIGVASSQEVVITDFPVGVAGSVNQDIFKSYYPDLKAIADTLNQYPLLRAVITGGADGERYRQNHDAKNPSLALGRAHALLIFMINEFRIDSSQIVIRTEDVMVKGSQYRYAGIRIAREISDIDNQLLSLKARIDTLENRPPLEKHFTEVKEVPASFTESFGMQLGVGFSSSPFGGIPVATAAVTFKNRLFLEGIVGHTFWDGSFTFEGFDLDTKRRLLGGHAVYYFSEELPVGIVGGWLRTEEIAQAYYEYTKLSEGLVLGLRGNPVDFLSITAAYNPSKHRVAGTDISKTENDQFLIYVTAHLAFGGAK